MELHLIFQGNPVIVLYDEIDQDLISQYNWTVIKSNSGSGAVYYHAVANYSDEGKRNVLLMSRLIMEAPTGLVVDHINHNKVEGYPDDVIVIDNRRSNLRVCTPQQNTLNRIKYLHTNSVESNKKFSLYKGVSWNKERNKWHVNVGFGGKLEFLGLYDDEIEAARAYDTRARQLHGEYALLNFPDSTEEVIHEKRVKSSKYIGVSFNKREFKYKVGFKVKGKSVHGGYFKDEETAARSYDTMARKLMLEDPTLRLPLNFPDSTEEVIYERKEKSSKYIGVSFSKRESKYSIAFRIKGKMVHTGGYFKDEEEAARKYDSIVKKLMSEDPTLKYSLNFPDQT